MSGVMVQNREVSSYVTGAQENLLGDSRHVAPPVSCSRVMPVADRPGATRY